MVTAKPRVLINEKTHTLVIQRQDQAGKWYHLRAFDPSVSIDHARTTMEGYARLNPDYGPCRLVEYVEVHTKTMEVL